jgi:NOL1/NOP2/fmu family ribosome biogenesis protein
VESRSILNGNNVELARTFYTWSAGLLVSSETNDRSGKRISSSENSYDGEGNLVNQVFKNSTGAITRKIATKWQNGLEIETQQTSADGKLQLKITNEYGSDGEVLKRIVENYQGNSKQIREFEYDYRPTRGRT